MEQKNITTTDALMDDADEATARKDFYQIAHSIEEKINEQPAMIEGGRLKDYQIKGSF